MSKLTMHVDQHCGKCRRRCSRCWDSPCPYFMHEAYSTVSVRYLDAENLVGNGEYIDDMGLIPFRHPIVTVGKILTSGKLQRVRVNAIFLYFWQLASRYLCQNLNQAKRSRPMNSLSRSKSIISRNSRIFLTNIKIHTPRIGSRTSELSTKYKTLVRILNLPLHYSPNKCNSRPFHHVKRRIYNHLHDHLL